MQILYVKKHWMLLDEKMRAIGIFQTRKEAEQKLIYLKWSGKQFGNHKKENYGFVS